MRHLFLAILILAVSVSIDSFGIGITYGIRNTTINKLSSFALFIISFLFSGFSILVGNVIFSIISDKCNIINWYGIVDYTRNN